MGVRYKAVWKGGTLLAEYEKGELTYLNPAYSAPKRSELATPTVIRDIGEYRSPLDGQMITTRSQHRDHMRAHDVIEVGNERIGSLSQPNTPKVDRELGMSIKRRIDEVQAMPQAQYDAIVQEKAHETVAAATEVAALVTPQE